MRRTVLVAFAVFAVFAVAPSRGAWPICSGRDWS